VSLERGDPFRQLVKGAMTGVLPRSALLAQGPRGALSVCLTFDDGPHPDHTPRLLDVLAEQGVVATFFVVGERAAEQTELVRRIAAEGHLLGGHSYTHGRYEQTSSRKLATEARSTAALLEQSTGQASTLFRPPHGKLTGFKLLRLWAERQTVVLWNVDPKDYARTAAEQVAEFFTARPLVGGDIVLLHDTHPHAAAVLPSLVSATRARGLEFTTVDAWM
jgi:peptidoglycan/xylan/chitin deacetylase (PgdA/CDA1 family)